MAMRPVRETIPFQRALALMLESARPIERTGRVRLQDAAGRVVAETIVAASDVPSFDRAAMDGYAVIAGDTAGASRDRPASLRCVAVVHSGEMPAQAIKSGECVQIATGAPLAAGADSVVMVEETARGQADNVLVRSPVSRGQNVSPRASDLAAGSTVLEPGALLTPARLGAAAAAGAGDLDVYARPVVAILSTGDELVEPGRPLGPAQIYDINRFTLASIVGAHGGIPQILATAADTVDDIAAGLERAARADVIVFSGGSSAGDKDLIVDVVRTAGQVVFHGISVKPGKPTLFGLIDGRPVLGMPGNPTSCLSNAYLLLVPLLRRIARLPEFTPRTVAVPLARRIVSSTDRHQFYTVRIVDGAAVPAFKSSGDITSMSQADGYFEIPAHTRAVESGEMVEVKLF